MWYLVTNCIKCEWYQSDYRILLFLCLKHLFVYFALFVLDVLCNFKLIRTISYKPSGPPLDIGYWNSTFYFVNTVKLPIRYTSQPTRPNPTHVNAFLRYYNSSHVLPRSCYVFECHLVYRMCTWSYLCVVSNVLGLHLMYVSGIKRSIKQLRWIEYIVTSDNEKQTAKII